MQEHMRTRKGLMLALNADQFGLLLEMAAIARWVVCSGGRFADDLYRAAVEELEQQLLGQAVSEGFAEYVHASEHDGSFCHVGFEDGDSLANEALREFSIEIFWNELAERLAPVLAYREAGSVTWSELDDTQRYERICDCENRARDAFDRHGIACLMLCSADAGG